MKMTQNNKIKDEKGKTNIATNTNAKQRIMKEYF
jgi:hypothetical protein